MGLSDVRRLYTRLVCSRDYTARPYEKVFSPTLITIDNDSDRQTGHGRHLEVLTRWVLTVLYPDRVHSSAHGHCTIHVFQQIMLFVKIVLILSPERLANWLHHAIHSDGSILVGRRH